MMEIYVNPVISVSLHLQFHSLEHIFKLVIIFSSEYCFHLLNRCNNNNRQPERHLEILRNLKVRLLIPSVYRNFPRCAREILSKLLEIYSRISRSLEVIAVPCFKDKTLQWLFLLTYHGLLNNWPNRHVIVGKNCRQVSSFNVSMFPFSQPNKNIKIGTR